MWELANDSLELSDFLPEVLVRNQVETVRIRSFDRAPSIQRREPDPRVQEIAEAAREESRSQGKHFFDSLMQLASTESPDVRDLILTQTLFHRHPAAEGIEHEIPREDFIELITLRHQLHSSSRIIALTSEMKSDSQLRHLPMLDFRIQPSASGIDLVTAMLEKLGFEGYLVDSGRSYHFYGGTLVSAQTFWAMLGSAALMSPFVDVRWIAHQLIDGRAAIRVSTNTGRHPSPLRLVSYSR